MARFDKYSNFDTEMGRHAKGYLRRKAFSTAIAAKMFVGKGPGSSGKLAATIKPDGRATKAATPGHFEIYVKAGSIKVDYALAHHEGSSPHTIKADAGGVLVFPTAGGIVYTSEVDHPGTRGNPYLVKALHATMADDGAKIVHRVE